MASLLELVRRVPAVPWQSGGIPWHEPRFSERMLREHLSQAHDLASRRSEVIDAHVQWIHTHLLDERPSRVLDLGCGPGLYTSRLGVLGHACAGIDFSPASIAYANEHASNGSCTYKCEDIRAADYGSGFELAMLISGEINAFAPADARAVVGKAYEALVPGGSLLIEPHTESSVISAGARPPSWYSAQGGLFADRPHLCLQERFWHADVRASTIRYHVIDAETSDVQSHVETRQAYNEDEYRTLLTEVGCSEILRFGTLDGRDVAADDLVVFVGRKRGSR